MSALTTFIQHRAKSSSQDNKARSEYKRHTGGKKEKKLSLIADDMIFHTENPKEWRKKNPSVISK